MNIINARAARAGLERLIDQVTGSHGPVTITGKRFSAVLVSVEDWNAIQETLFLLSVPGMRESIKDAMAEPLSKKSQAGLDKPAYAFVLCLASVVLQSWWN